MPKFRNKPVEIFEVEATQWFKNGDHPNDYVEDRVAIENDEPMTITGEECKRRGWEGGFVRYFRHPMVQGDKACGQCGKLFNDHGWIDSSRRPPHGLTVCPGNWVCTDANGEVSVVAEKLFDQVFEPAPVPLTVLQ